MTFMTINVFQGMAVVLVYSNPLFKEAIPEEILSVATCSIILAIVCVVFGMIASYVIDRNGRRPLMIISSVIVGLCHVALGTQIHLRWGPPWFTAIYVYLLAASYHCGAGTVPYVFTSEVFLPEVKMEIDSNILTVLLNLSLFRLYLLKAYNFII
ncbi:unnamed protein product [Diatraea saccharalis]|uniref:Major facilitator superfamily (MFS) profile domain-containing protein n=1 Tax=Diatraea saccharalis TaxID=40085 RepID=A0A9N9RAI2_9NEOP|nr:unnamed protein product [Diatraea saccharalis]